MYVFGGGGGKKYIFYISMRDTIIPLFLEIGVLTFFNGISRKCKL